MMKVAAALNERQIGVGRHEILADSFDRPAARFDQPPGLDIRREHGARRIGENRLGRGRAHHHAAADAGDVEVRKGKVPLDPTQFPPWI